MCLVGVGWWEAQWGIEVRVQKSESLSSFHHVFELSVFRALCHVLMDLFTRRFGVFHPTIPLLCSKKSFTSSYRRSTIFATSVIGACPAHICTSVHVHTHNRLVVLLWGITRLRAQKLSTASSDESSDEEMPAPKSMSRAASQRSVKSIKAPPVCRPVHISSVRSYQTILSHGSAHLPSVTQQTELYSASVTDEERR